MCGARALQLHRGIIAVGNKATRGVSKAWPLVLGKPCPGSLVWRAFRRCDKHLTLRLPKRSCVHPIVCWLERRVMSADSSLADKYAVGCLLCAIWGFPALGLFRYSWSRAAWWVYLPELRPPRRACTGAPCCLASLGLRLRAGACPFGRLSPRFCSRVVQNLTASLISCRPSCRDLPLLPLYAQAGCDTVDSLSVAGALVFGVLSAPARRLCTCRGSQS